MTTSVRRGATILAPWLALAAAGCAHAYREATLPPTVAPFLGLGETTSPSIEVAPLDDLAALERRDRERLVDRDSCAALRLLFAAGGADGAVQPATAAHAAPTDLACTARFDSETGRVLVAFPAGARGRALEGLLGPRAAREHEIASAEAQALALVDAALDGPHRATGARPSRDDRRDRRGNDDAAEARAALLRGAAYAAALEASIAPIHAVDASAPRLARLHGRIARAVLDDPHGAPAELLADGDLPDATRFALERLSRTEGAAREREAFRVFAGARFIIEAKRRLSNANLGLVFADPPHSTEQILWPERWFDRDDPPGRIDVGVAGRGAREVRLAGTPQRTVVVGAAGLLDLLRAAVGPRRARSVAEGWRADALTVQGDGDARFVAWRLEFDGEGDAGEAARALEDALATGADGRPHVTLRREGSAVALVAGGETASHAKAIVALLAERAVAPEDLARGGTQDPAFRWVRAAASPFLFDALGRHETALSAAYGLVARHRAHPGGAETDVIDPGLPGLPCFDGGPGFLPRETAGLLAHVERGPERTDAAFLLRSVRAFGHAGAGTSRFWSPLVSWTRGDGFAAFALGYGLIFEAGGGAGMDVLAPRPLFSREVALDGDDASFGVLFDLLRARVRAEREVEADVLPYGFLVRARRFLAPVAPGFEVGLLWDAIRLARRDVVPDKPRTEFALLGGHLLQVDRDRAAASGTCALGRLDRDFALALWETRTSESSRGLLRVGDRHLFGFGRRGRMPFVDVLFFRW